MRSLIVPEYRKTIAAVMRDAGIKEYRYEMGGRHPKLIYEKDGVERFYVLPGSPGDTVRGALNCEAELRRTVGAPKRRKKAAAKPYRKPVKAAPKKPAPIAPVKPDPFEVLAELRARIEPIPEPWWRRVPAIFKEAIGWR